MTRYKPEEIVAKPRPLALYDLGVPRPRNKLHANTLSWPLCVC